MREDRDKVNILLVDDREDSLLALEAVLEEFGQNLVKARSGKEALKHVLTADFAVILLDVQMPEMDGFETADLIRQREKSRGTPIIFITAAYKTPAHVFRGYATGAVDYIFKPIVPEILKSKVGVFIDLAKKNAALRRLNETLQIQASKLAAANKELEAFSYSVSHDLYRPLRGIGGFSQILLSRYSDRLDDQGREYLQRVEASVRRMGQALEDLLRLSRLTQKEMEYAAADLSEMARTILHRLQKEQSERRVSLSVEEGVQAAGDPGLLFLLLENLLDNAWKFTQKSRDAKIEFGIARSEEGPAYFVRDNGVGFDMAAAGQLFKPFRRLHPEREFQGTGIGLATAQRIVNRHGGRLWAESVQGQGATFYFTLPRTSEDGA